YLRLAVRSWDGKRPSLPPLGPEFSRDIAGFTRRYIRTVLAGLGPTAIVVLDDLHEADPHSDLYCALSDAIENTKRGAQLILIRREQPQPGLACPEPSRAMSTVSAEQLEFTIQETESLLSARGGAGRNIAQELHDLCRGWAAGLSLLIE